MNHFQGSLLVEPIDEEDWFVVRKAFAYLDDDPRYCITVPEGFITDFASVPKVFWPIMSPIDPHYRTAAVCHDRAYEMQLPKEDSDMILYRASEVTKAPRWRREALWWAVHMGGGSSWRTAPQRQIERLEVYKRLVAAGKA